MELIQCENCGTLHELNSRFCKNCGTNLYRSQKIQASLPSQQQDRKYCIICSLENNIDNKFCEYCGADFKTAKKVKKKIDKRDSISSDGTNIIIYCSIILMAILIPALIYLFTSLGGPQPQAIGLALLISGVVLVLFLFFYFIGNGDAI